ncbi:MAG TPA: VOC family protein [Actinoplanes sp.]
MLTQLTVTFDAADPARLALFWADMLSRVTRADTDGVLIPGTDTQVGLRFVAGASGKPVPNRLHLHLTSTDQADQQRMVTTALGLGASHLDVGQRPEEGHLVLADPEGNAFCVIEPGNNYLAGCGLLGEVACEGTREVGLFWSAAMGWPLVWDQHGETAIQSPRGGTKVAWGGQPTRPEQGPSRQRFELTAADGDQQAEVDRLVALGATPLQADSDGVTALADPDGWPFSVMSSHSRSA